MAEYINREVLRDELLNISIDTSNLYGCGVLEGLDRATKRLNEQPAADVAPVRHGRWECNKPCPVCGRDRFEGLDADIWADWEPPYCPNCGAKMNEVSE